MSKFPVAHVSSVGDLFSVIQYSAHRLDVTVGHANVSLEYLFTNVPCDKRASVSLGQLNFDLCTPSVNLMLSLAVYATRSPSCPPPACPDQFCLEQQIKSFVAAQAGPLLPLTIYV